MNLIKECWSLIQTNISSVFHSTMRKRPFSTLLADGHPNRHHSLPHEPPRPRIRPKLNHHSDPLLEPSLSYPDISRPIARQTPFQQPTQLLSFSYNSAHELEFNDSALRYFVDPPRDASLEYGYDRWVRRPETRGRVDGLLQAFLKAKEKDPSPFLQDIGAVAWRGVITKCARFLP